MNERPTPENFEELAGLVKASFPDLRCLRCGHNEFYTGLSEHTLARRDPNTGLRIAYMGDEHEILTLGCTRCGHLEQHMLDVLDNAKKPIPSASR